MNQRDKELKELDKIESERRKVAQEDLIISIFRNIINIIRWFLSIMFFIVSFSFFGEEDAILKMCIGLVITVFLNPVSFNYIRSLIKKEG